MQRYGGIFSPQNIERQLISQGPITKLLEINYLKHRRPIKISQSEENPQKCAFFPRFDLTFQNAKELL